MCLALCRGVATLQNNCHYTSLVTLNAAMQASENPSKLDFSNNVRKSCETILRNGTDSLSRGSNYSDSLSRKSVNSGSDSLSRKSNNSEDYTYILNEMMSAGSSMSLERLPSTPTSLSGPLDTSSTTDIPRATLLSTERYYGHSREASKISTTSSELSYNKELWVSASDAKENSSYASRESYSMAQTNSIMPGPASPVVKDLKSFYQNQKGSLTLPLQKGKSTPTSGARYSLYNLSVFSLVWRSPARNTL